MIWTDRGIGRKDWKLLLERKSLAGPLRQSRARPNKLLHKSPSTYHQIRVILSRKSRKWKNSHFSKAKVEVLFLWNGFSELLNCLQRFIFMQTGIKLFPFSHKTNQTSKAFSVGRISEICFLKLIIVQWLQTNKFDSCSRCDKYGIVVIGWQHITNITDVRDATIVTKI